MVEPDVKAWMVIAGKPTEVLIDGSIFCVRADAPDNLDPVSVARDFMKVYDTSKTAIKRKAISAQPTAICTTAEGVKPKPVLKNKTRMIHKRNEIAIGKIHNIPIYKSDIIGFYKKFPSEFTTRNFSEYLETLYPGIQSSSAKNKANVYLKYLKDENIVEHVSGKANVQRKYKFKAAPFGATLPAQAEFDAHYMQGLRLLEMRTVREG